MCPAETPKNKRRGYIIPIGGAEDKTGDMSILRLFIRLAGQDAAKIVVIPTASRLKRTGPDYNKIFCSLGAEESDTLPITKRQDGDDPAFVKLLEEATGIFITGGNQLRLSTILGGTEIARCIRRANAHGTVVAGTSAGASIMSQHMMAGGKGGLPPVGRGAALAPGLGLTNTAIIDQHFTQRNRLGRLLSASSYNPNPLAIGIDEDTAAFIGPDNVFKVVGSGTITVVDSTDLSFSSISTAAEGQPLSLLGLKLDILSRGSRYDLSKRRAYPPKERENRDDS